MTYALLEAWASQVALVVKNLPANAGDARGMGSIPGSKVPWGMKWQPTPVFLPRKLHEKGSWWAIVHGVAKSWTQLSTHMHI